MNAHNQAIGDLPRNAIKTFSGLVHTLAYLNNLIAATSGRQVRIPFDLTACASYG